MSGGARFEFPVFLRLLKSHNIVFGRFNVVRRAFALISDHVSMDVLTVQQYIVNDSSADKNISQLADSDRDLKTFKPDLLIPETFANWGNRKTPQCHHHDKCIIN